MKNKTKFALSIAGIIINLALIVFVAVLADNKIISEGISSTIAVILIIPLFAICFYAGTLEHRISVYECRKCNHIFKPTKSEYICGPHSITTRYLKCPECGEKSWCVRKNDADA